MTVSTYRPTCQILLVKAVDREDGVARRYAKAARLVDLTPYLGSGGSVTITKSIDEPCGAFTVSFADKIRPDLADSVYAGVEAMDVIEIRAAREPHLYASQKLPLIMRGFVSRVERSEEAGNNGAPRRIVSITGHDAGKLMQIHRIVSQLMTVLEQPYLETFQLQATTGMPTVTWPVSQFMSLLIENVVNPKVQALAAVGGSGIKPFTVDAQVSEGLVSNIRLASATGSLFDIATAFADRPWNEWFIEDSETGPVVRFRPAPFRSAQDDSFVIDGATDPGTIDISDSDVVRLRLWHGDDRVANFYWVPPGDSAPDTAWWAGNAALNDAYPLDLDYANSLQALYGTREMRAFSRLLPPAVSVMPASQPADRRVSALNQFPPWHKKRATQLRDMNRDNAVFEEGRAVLKGSEALKPGQYLRLTRGGVVASAYMTRVNHSLSPLQGWISTAILIRGTGFLTRNKMPGSPYLLEGMRGPYSR
ncbi:MAG: hypothetical protein P4M00_05175 [Azospirillaceae bacterium]|nr:hypothetical protein [Azospirillaceae bacterium]